MTTTGDGPRDADRISPVPEPDEQPRQSMTPFHPAENDPRTDADHGLNDRRDQSGGRDGPVGQGRSEKSERQGASNGGPAGAPNRPHSGRPPKADTQQSSPSSSTADTPSAVNNNSQQTSKSGGPPTDGRGNQHAPSGGQQRSNRSGQRGNSGKSWPKRPRARGRRYAALDLGTNNCRLLVAEPQHRGFRIVDAFSRIIRLGEGLSRNGSLSDQAMDRTVDALRVCGRKLKDSGVSRARLIATEACRTADNGQAFLDRVEDETGLHLEIVDRATEARLAVAGCATLVDPKSDGVVLFDIGGGSSEIVWLDLSLRDQPRVGALVNCIRSWTSLPVGVVNLSERHGGVHVDAQVFEDMIEDVSTMLGRLPEDDALREVISGGNVHMLGTSGTVTTLAGVHLNLERYDRRRVDGTWLSADDVQAMVDRLLSMEFEQRVANPCIGADRADLVMAGCAILEAMRRRWPCNRLRVADRGLREGILVELMVADGVWSRRRRRRGYRGDRQRSRANPPPGSKGSSDG